jgi:hypothetical protein
MVSSEGLKARLADGPSSIEGVAIHLLRKAGTGTSRDQIDLYIWAFLE